MTNSSPPPEPSQPSQPRRPILNFDEMVAIIVAFATIGAILFWSWGGRKVKILSQTQQKIKSTIEETTVLNSEAERRFGSRLSFAKKADEDEVEPVIVPETKSQPQQVNPFNFSLSNNLTSQKRDRSLPSYRKPIIALPAPTPPTETQPPTTAETTTPPTITQPPATTETPAPPTVTFADVPSDHWAYPFIEPLIEKDLIVGITEKQFQPDRPITRAQLATEIEKAFKQGIDRDLINFEDVTEENRIANKIDEAVKTGFLKGYPGQVFRPNQQVPRLQVLVALASGLDLKPSRDPEVLLNSYQDADKIPNWATEKIAAAIEAGLVVNRPDFDIALIYPDEFATRAEVVAMIYQALVKAGRIEKISSPYVVPNR